jgi:uncharacterized protein (TIGR02246 family)
MRTKALVLLAGGLIVAVGVGVYAAREAPQPPSSNRDAAEGAGKDDKKPEVNHQAAEVAGKDDKGHEAARDAIRKSAREFEKAFDRGDARAVAAFWTEEGEYYDDAGVELRGRAAIEKAYAELFKASPMMTVEIETQSVHFPADGTAVADGILRFKAAGAGLKTSSRYSVLYVRQGGDWKVAIAREWGANDDKLEDLAWLVGSWVAKFGDREVQMSFEWNNARTLIRGRVTRKDVGILTWSATETIGLDPQTGFLHSWVFDDEGGRAEALWARDGNRWVQDVAGTLFDGAQYTAVNVLTPLNDDEFIWRSIDRTILGSPVPDTDPIKLKRVTGGK